MAAGDFSRDDDARTLPRFVPKDRLSMFVAGKASPLVHGDIKDLSELGACVRTDTALENGRIVTINVKSGYSFLFRAEGRVVWRAQERRPRDTFDCSHGVLFTEMSPFTKKLIRRLGGPVQAPPKPPSDAPLEGIVWDSDSDPDLQILFRAERDPSEIDNDRPDQLADVVRDLPLEAPLAKEPASADVLPDRDGNAETLPDPPVGVDEYLDSPSMDRVEPIEWRDATEAALAPKLAAVQERTTLAGDVELSGSLGYFDCTDVLQMLEASRATGVLFVEGPVVGEIHFLEGRICRCVAEGFTDEEAAAHLVVARSGRFHFVPCPVPESARRIRTTTQLVLEAHLKRDRKR